jgi:mannose-6-phosphate isomerase
MEVQGERLLGTAVRPAFGGRFPILVKFLFTSERLSVQVHPDDTYAEENEGSPGKTEMWYILRAERGATLAAGFRETLHPAALREAVHDGSVTERLMWWPARAGDTFFIPARTVHAVGGGFVICEIQQNSDITYRLWDYGRPRELHVESSIAVADLGPHPGPVLPSPFGGGTLLAACPYFATERFTLNEMVEWHSDVERFHLLVIARGTGELSANRFTGPVEQGQCWLIPARCGTYRITGTELEILRVYVPA